MKPFIFALAAFVLIALSLVFLQADHAAEPDRALDAARSGPEVLSRERKGSPNPEQEASLAQTRSSGETSEIELLVMGNVAGREASPIGGARVTGARMGSLGPGRVFELKTDSRGRALIPGPSPVRVRVQAPGHLSSDFALDEGAKSKRVVLPSMGRLVVRVVDSEGGARSAAKGALRVATGSGQGDDILPSSRLEQAAQADQGGVLCFDGLPPGVPIDLAVMAPGYSQVTQVEDALLPGEVRELVITLDLRGGMSLTVLDQLGRPLPGALVTAFQLSSGSARAVKKVTTDLAGLADLRGLKSGRHAFVATGWDKSGSAVFCLEALGTAVAGERRDLGILRPAGTPSQLQMNLTEVGVEARTVRVIAGAIAYRREPKEEYLATFKTDLPMGRTVRLWTSVSGMWSFTLMVTQAGSPMLDTTVKSQVRDVVLPTDLVVDFEATEQSKRGVVSYTVPASNTDGGPKAGFLALLCEGEVQMAAELQAEDNPVTGFLYTRREGRHRLIGCVGEVAFEEWVDVQFSVPQHLGLLKSHPATLLTLDALWPDASPMEDTRLEVVLGTGDGDEDDPYNPFRALQYAAGSSWNGVALPLGLPVSLRFVGKQRAATIPFEAIAPGRQTVHLGVTNPDR
ncbi:MAG: carboxypeptidase-like regulatory domain-containing protein, partial [bacterium]